MEERAMIRTPTLGYVDGRDRTLQGKLTQPLAPGARHGCAEAVSHRFQFTAIAEPFQVSTGASPVHGYAWRRSDPAETVTLIHGLQSHSQWFAESAQLLWEQGYSVYVLDRRGSGSSQGAPGDIGRYSEWFEEVAEVMSLARSEHPGMRHHLVGHCFGASVALGCALKRPELVTSFAILSPGFHVLPEYPLPEKLRILAWGVARPETRFRTVLQDELFTSDPNVLAWIQQDALGTRDFTARCLLQILAMNTWLRRNLRRLEVPLLVLEAGRDRISDNRRNREVLSQALGKRARIVSFDAEHLLLTEPCRDEVIETLVRWFSAAEPS